MGEMPLITVFESDARQIRSDTSRAKQVWNIEGIFTRLAHRAPAARFACHRTNILGVAIPAAFAQIHAPAELLHRSVIGGVGHHPLELAQIGANDRGHPSGPR